MFDALNPSFDESIFTTSYDYLTVIIPLLTIILFVYFQWKIQKYKLQISLQLKIHIYVWILCMVNSSAKYMFQMLILRWEGKKGVLIEVL